MRSITPHLRAKSRLRRLRSETRLRAQSRGEGAPKGREWNAGDNPLCGTCKDLLKLFVLLSLLLRAVSNITARIPLPTSLRSATFSPGEGLSGRSRASATIVSETIIYRNKVTEGSIAKNPVFCYDKEKKHREESYELRRTEAKNGRKSLYL